MDSYEVYKKFLSENDIHYAEDTLQNGDRFLRMPHRIKSGAVVDVLIIFSERNIKVVVFGVATISDDAKKIEYYELFNRLNGQYSFFKFYLRPNGDINLEGDAVLGIVEGEFNPKSLMGFVVAALSLIEETYGELMKIQWS